MIEVVVDDLAFVEADAILRPADDTLAPLTPAMKRLDLQAAERVGDVDLAGPPDARGRDRRARIGQQPKQGLEGGLGRGWGGAQSETRGATTT